MMGNAGFYQSSKKQDQVCHSATQIIDKYAEHHLCVNKRMLLLVVPSNQKMTEYLKEIADLCGIDKKLTSHIARHTFVTT